MIFKFPDPADFPENDAEVFSWVTDSKTELPAFSERINFSRDLTTLSVIIENFGGFNPEEKLILMKQLKAVSQSGVRYFSRVETGESELTRDGVAHRLVDTSALTKYFHEGIKQLQEKPNKESLRIDEVDRSYTYTDISSLSIVRSFLYEVGLLHQVQRYAQQRVKVRSVTLMVARPFDRHHYQQFQDCETETKLLNLHVDPKPGVMKAVIYLSEVGIWDGPFSVVEGSNHFEYDEVERIFAWGNSTSNYLHTPMHRRVACAFPKRFRKTSIIGRLIPDGSKMSDWFLKNLKRYYSDEATVMVFDPCFVFHRGGLIDVEEHERVTLNVVMR